MSAQSRTLSMGDWLTTLDVARLLAISERTARRRVDHWRAIGYPRVRRVALDHGHFGYEVSREEFDAYCAGESSPAIT